MDSLSCYPFPDYLLLSSTYSQDQQFIETKVREFVGKRASCLIKEAYRNECFPESLIQGFGELGILGASLKGYNLPGMDAIASGLIMKELERCDSALRSFVSVQSSLVMYPILAFGSEAQKEEWLPLLASGKKIGCFGLTEESGDQFFYACLLGDFTKICGRCVRVDPDIALGAILYENFGESALMK